ncbi:hypothetical protein CSA56_15385 [candidate division KSB3 bacterium]|uniref:DZANK-type domain-containing protein n=1 Tax=candidate division KSB3 bacterium TaxID=2044937 RepID=A0A2G6K9Y6_9BACT|nr:MAG: hypothetical protein CSA56_15385 [candidate division KSB3 bacterium]
MAQELYNVVFYGEIGRQHTREEAQQKLAQLFKCSVQQAERFFTGKKIIIKAKADHQAALKYQRVFEQAGTICHIEVLEIESKMTCPKCGFKQDKSEECIHCGIIIKHYLKSHPESKPGTEKKEGMMICPKCGTEQEEAKRCSYCGVFIKNYLKAHGRESERQESRKPKGEYRQITQHTHHKQKEFPEPSTTDRIFSKLVARVIGVLLVIGISGIIGFYTTQEQFVSGPSDEFGLKKPRGWVMESDLNNEADIQIANAKNEGYLVVMSELKVDFENFITYRMHSNLTRKFLRDSVLNYREVSGPTEILIGSMKGVQYEITGSVDGLNMKYLHTTLEGRKYFHQISAWSLISKYDSNKPAFDKILESFYEY